MKNLKSARVAAVALMASAGLAAAECDIEGEGSVRILSNDFEALHIIAGRAEECAGDGVTVTKNQTTEHKVIQVPALTTNPATYTVAIVANNSVVPLLSEGLVRPLDDLVEKYGSQLNDNQLIRIDGRVMAIAMMVNAQHAYYRADAFEEAGLELPTTYEEVIEAAGVIREMGIMENPLAASFKPGFDLAEEFVNMYVGLDGQFFEPGSPEPAIQNDKAITALETLREMTEYMARDYMTYDTNAVKPVWEADQIAFWNGWGSRAGAFVAEDSPAPEIASNTTFGAAPTVGGESIPAGTLWWDGFTIASNISDEDAEASFQAMMYGIAPEMVEGNEDVAAWLISGYEPTEALQGVFATMEEGGRPFPMTPYMGLLFTALGDNLAEFMQGQESAEQALTDASNAYRTAAREAGYLN